jgi:hypothetical protein
MGKRACWISACNLCESSIGVLVGKGVQKRDTPIKRCLDGWRTARGKVNGSQQLGCLVVMVLILGTDRGRKDKGY